MNVNTYIANRLVAFAIAVLCFPSPVVSQRTSPTGELVTSDRSVKFTVNYPRPLESVTYTLRHKYGVLVTFEEAPLEHFSDIVDPNKDSLNEGRTFLPRGGQLEFSFELSENRLGLSDPIRALETAIDAYHQQEYPGRYSLQKSGEYFHIVPRAIKNTQGAMTNVGSPLDAIVTITGEARHPHLILRELTTAVGKSSGYNVYIAHSPFLRGSQSPVPCDCVNMSARAVLRKLLETTGKRATWLMMYDIKNRSYYLSIQ